MSFYGKQTASRLGRSLVNTLSSASSLSTVFGAQVRQIRVVTTLPIWATVGSSAVVTANSSATYLVANFPETFAVSPGQSFNYLSTSTSSGYVTVTEML
jgi:hypothetical protein